MTDGAVEPEPLGKALRAMDTPKGRPKSRPTVAGLTGATVDDASSPTRMEEGSIGPALSLRGLTKEFPSRGQPTLVLEDITFDLNVGEFVAIVGPSGCGKSSLLNILAGIDQKTSGVVAFHDAGEVGTLHCAYMFQNDLLLPWRTIVDNVALGLVVQGVDRKSAQRRSSELLERFKLDDYADRRPMHLSGGMRQRVALLRTMVLERPILLLDEPFGALDALTRAHMQDWLLDVWQQDQRSVLFVTHDVEEAIFLADRVLVFDSKPGRIKDSFIIPFHRPRTRSVQATPEFAELKAKVLAQIY